jgi:anthranilate phosphoribosyltransferase
VQEAICVNAAAAIVAYENLDLEFETAINLAYARAKGSVASGMSLNKLKNWQEFSKSIS